MTDLPPDLADLGRRYDELYHAAANGDLPADQAIQLVDTLVTVDPHGNRWRVDKASNPGQWAFERTTGPDDTWQPAAPTDFTTPPAAAPAPNPFAQPDTGTAAGLFAPLGPTTTPTATPHQATPPPVQLPGLPPAAPHLAIARPNPDTTPTVMPLPGTQPGPADRPDGFPPIATRTGTGPDTSRAGLLTTIKAKLSTNPRTGRTLTIAVALIVVVALLLVFRPAPSADVDDPTTPATTGATPPTTDGPDSPLPTTPATTPTPAAAATPTPTAAATTPASAVPTPADDTPPAAPTLDQAAVDRLVTNLTAGDRTQVHAAVATTVGDIELALRAASYAGFGPAGLTMSASAPTLTSETTGQGTLTLTDTTTAGTTVATAAVTYTRTDTGWAYTEWPTFTPTSS